jgi:hypothetical protein
MIQSSVFNENIYRPYYEKPTEILPDSSCEIMKIGLIAQIWLKKYHHYSNPGQNPALF